MTLKRGFETLEPEDLFDTDGTLRVKFGIDPTGDNLHLGHAVALFKLRQLQEAGHTVVLIVGTFTARIGDPTGRDETRSQRDEETVAAHAESVLEQARTVLHEHNLEVHHNHEWLEELDMEDALTLAGSTSVARMLERNDFAERFEEGSSIRLHEFFYPLLQARDSVQVRSDVEIGGTDQLFNLHMGRELQRQHGQGPQAVATLPLLVAPSGSDKMGTTDGNAIPIQADPAEQFGQLMSVSDANLPEFARLLTKWSSGRFEDWLAALDEDPKAAKKAVAHRIVEQLHGHDEADEAQRQFERTFEEDQAPDRDDAETVRMDAQEPWIVEVIEATGEVDSRNEAKQLLKQGGIHLDGETLDGFDHDVDLSGGQERALRIGKHRFFTIKRSQRTET